MASVYLFRGIFAITGPLSRILQGVNIDFCKAIQLVDASLIQLKKLRESPQSILPAVESDFDGIEWFEKRIVRKKLLPGEINNNKPATTAKEKWERDIFYAAIDSVIVGVDVTSGHNDDIIDSSDSTFNSLMDCLKILCMYDLVDAYPNLCRVYSIAVAIPVIRFLMPISRRKERKCSSYQTVYAAESK